MLLILLLILGGNQVIIRLFSSFSNKLISEYEELYDLQEFKTTLSSFFILDHAVHPNTNRTEIIDPINIAFEKCQVTLNDIHKGGGWSELERLRKVVSDNYLAQVANGIDQVSIQRQLLPEISKMIFTVNQLIEETREEIKIYQTMNRKVRLHGTVTIIVFGVGLSLVMTIGGFKFVRILTEPIERLVEATGRIGQGKMDERVTINTNDEFETLAASFNQMLDKIDQTTVSEVYLHNILNNLYGALIVCDKDLKIKSVNSTSIKLLGYSEPELLGLSLTDLIEFRDNPYIIELVESSTVEGLRDQIASLSEMKTKDGNSIPVYTTCSILNDRAGNFEGFVIVGHDQTRERERERKLELARKERVIAINDAQEQERVRIANDIHDGLGQMLTGISYSIQELSDACNAEPELVDKLHKQVDGTIQEAKNIAQNLTPIILKDFGLIAAIQNLVYKTNQVHDTEVIFNAYDFNDRLDPKLEKAIFRICQEALNNILKHAQAKTASMELFREYRSIALVIEDDGIGFDTNEIITTEKDRGIGLMSMRERVSAFDGVFTIESKPGQGTEIVVELPCRKNRKS